MLDEREMARQARRAVRWNTLALTVLAGVVLLLVVWYGLNRWQHTYTPDKWFSAPMNGWTFWTTCRGNTTWWA